MNNKFITYELLKLTIYGYRSIVGVKGVIRTFFDANSLRATFVTNGLDATKQFLVVYSFHFNHD